MFTCQHNFDNCICAVDLTFSNFTKTSDDNEKNDKFAQNNHNTNFSCHHVFNLLSRLQIDMVVILANMYQQITLNLV